MWRIYDYRGVGKAVVHEVEYEGNEGEVRTLTCSINSPMPIEWEVTDNVRYRGETFYLRHIPSAKKQARKGTHEEAFVYDNVVFYSAIDELASCDFLDVVKEDNNLHYTSLPNFSFYCETIHDIADRLQANLDRLYTGSKKWTIQVSTDITAKVDIKPQVLSFSSEKCSQVLERIYNDLGVTYEHTNRTIVFGAKPIMMPYEFKYGKGKGLKSIEQSGADGNALVTRARVYGSTRNLPNRYYNKLYKNSKTGAVMYFKTDDDKPKDFETYWTPLISETMYVPNLMLPMFRENGKDAYIDATDAIAKYGLREGTKFFDSNNGEDEEIYPTIENMTADRLEELGYTPELHDGDNGKLDELLYVDDVPFSGVMPEGGNLPASEAHFVVYLKDIGFDINDYLVGTPKISFRSGALAGREFDIVKCEQTALINKTYKLTCKRVEDTSIQLIFPYKDYKPSAGDKFVLLEIDMPEIYIKVAELRLKEEGEKWLGLNSNPIFTYNPEIDAVNVLRNPQIAENLKEGRTFIFSDEDLGISKAIRISNLRIKDNGFAPEYEITLSDKHTVSLAEKVTQSVVNMIGSNNASTENIKALIEAYGNNLFLNKKKRDTAEQVIRFTLGLEVGENKATINANGDAEVESLTSRSRVKASEVMADNIHTTDYEQGALLGTGGAIYQLEGATYAEFDYLTARKGAIFVELIIQKYRSIGGALVISQANGEIESIYDYGNGYNIWTKDDDKSDSLFVNNDLVRCQYWDRSKNKLVYYWAPVSVSEDSQGRYVLTIYKKDMNGVVPQVGDKLVQMGNTTDTSRQGCILLTTENSLPRMAILDGINSTTLSNANYKGIYGSLDGFVDPYTGKALSGYGMWGENVYLHGDLILSSTNKSVSDEIKSQISKSLDRNYARLTAIPVEINQIESMVNATKFIYSVTGFQKGDEITISFDWEMLDIVPETNSSFISIQFDDVYGYCGTGFRLTTDQIGSGSGHHSATVTIKGRWDANTRTPTGEVKPTDVSRLYIRFDNVTINSGSYFKISNLRVNKGSIPYDWQPAPEDANTQLEQYKEVVAEDIEYLQKQIDGKVESWFYDYDPTLDNFPTNEWTTNELKESHIGDTFTNTQDFVNEETTPNAGKSWRWLNKDGVYGWYIISDTDATKALELASKAQDTADGKRRVFVDKPTLADVYDVGDLWVNATYKDYVDDLLRCKISKNRGVPFSIGHWEKASKYTDDSAANDALDSVQQLTTKYEGFVEATNQNFLSVQQSITTTNNAVANNTNSGRNLLLGTNKGIENWNLSSSLNKPTNYNIIETIYNDVKGVKFVKLQSDIYAQWEIFFFSLRPEYIIKGKTYTLSFDAKFSNIDTSKTRLGAIIASPTGESMLTNYHAVSITKDSSWQHYEINILAKESGVIGGSQVVYLYIVEPSTTFWEEISFANLKLEQSTIATPWSPAPEDAEESIKASEQILESEIKQTADAISLKVKETEYYTTSNLIVGSYKQYKSTNYLLAKYKLADVKPKHGDTVTLSFSGKIEDIQNQFNIFNSGGTVAMASVYRTNLNSDTGRYECKFIWLEENSNGVTASNTEIWVYQGKSYSDEPNFILPSSIYDVMLTRTDKAVAYKPTPTDVENKLKDTGIDIESKKITVTADNFQVQNNEGKQTAGVDRFGNLSANTIMTRFANGKLAITANQSVIDVESNQVSTDRMLKFYYDNENNNVQFEIGWDAATASLMRYYDTDGKMLWQVGSEKGFVAPTIQKVIRQKQYWYLGSFSEITAERAFTKASNESADNVISIYGQSFESSTSLDNYYFDEYLYNPVSGYITTSDYTEYIDGRLYRPLFRIENGKFTKSADAWMGSSNDDVPNDWKE